MSANTIEVKDQEQKQEVAVSQEKEVAENRRVFIPSVDIIDNGEETVLYADMPGVDCDNVEITVEKNVLTLKGESQKMDYSGYELVYSEYGVGDFERSFTLSETVDRDNISAAMKDGVLTVKLPKAAPKTRKISVASAE